MHTRCTGRRPSGGRGSTVAGFGPKVAGDKDPQWAFQRYAVGLVSRKWSSPHDAGCPSRISPSSSAGGMCGCPRSGPTQRHWVAADREIGFEEFPSGTEITTQYLSCSVIFAGDGTDPPPLIYDYGPGVIGRILHSHDWYAPMVVSFVEPTNRNQ